MERDSFIFESLLQSAEIKRAIYENCKDDICKAIDIILKSVKDGKKILFIGNGGSAADCQHLATEFMIRLSHDLNRPAIPAISLTTDSSNLTAGGNDIGFDNVFARNIQGLGNAGDVLFAISTSGNSPNILKAIEIARTKEIFVVGLTGKTGGKMKNLCDSVICVPSDNIQRIQEGHITIGHIICELTERELYGN